MGTISTTELARRKVTRAELGRIRPEMTGDESSEIVRALWPYLQAVKLVGFLPVSGPPSNLRFSWISFLTIYSLVLFFNELFVTVLQFGKSMQQFRDTNVSEVVGGLMDLIYHIHVVGVSFVGLWRARSLGQWCHTCQRVEVILARHQRDDKLVLTCWVVSALSLTLTAVTCTTYFVSVGVRNATRSWDDYLRAVADIYVDESMVSAMSGYYSLTLGFIMEFVWAIGDTLLLLLSIAHRKLFQRLNEALESYEDVVPTPEAAEELRAHHVLAAELVQAADDLFSPLTLLNYISLVTYLFCRLYLGMIDDLLHPSPLMIVEGSLAFLQVMLRIFLPSYYAATMYEEAHRASIHLARWGMVRTQEKESCFVQRVLLLQRFQLQLSSMDCGFTGCGFFVITKGFVTGLVSGLITYEIVILQFSNGAKEHHVTPSY